MHRLIAPFVRLLVVLAIAVAMTGSSFAHRIATPDTDESLLAYVAAGGVLDDLCGQAGFGAGGAESCDACRLADGAVVPASSFAALSDIDMLVLHDQLAVPAAPILDIANPSCPVRAPPVV